LYPPGVEIAVGRTRSLELRVEFPLTARVVKDPAPLAPLDDDAIAILDEIDGMSVANGFSKAAAIAVCPASVGCTPSACCIVDGT